MDGGYDIILSSSNGDYGPNYDDNDLIYSGPIGNGLDPISDLDSEEPEEDIPLTCLDTPSDSFSSNSTTVAATEKKRTETGFGKVGGFLREKSD